MLHILLVEDNLKYVRLLESVIEDADSWKITHAANLKQALACLEQGTFDIVISDLFLPDSQGLDSIARIQEKCPQIPIVFLTAMDDPNIRQQALERGAKCYLLKDQIVESLIPTVQEVLATSS